MPDGLPASILVGAGDGVGKDRQRYRAEAGEADERLSLPVRSRAILLLDQFEHADGRNDVSRLGTLPGGERQGQFRRQPVLVRRSGSRIWTGQFGRRRKLRWGRWRI